MSIVTYNGITLPYPYATHFEQEAAYESSNTDWYINRFIIQVQCVLNWNYLSQLMPSLISGRTAVSKNPADIKNAIYTKLMTPRKTLSFKVNGVEMMPSAVIDGRTVDSQNGPQPQRCVLTNLTSESFILSWSCIAHYWINNSAGVNSSSPVVTNAAGGMILYNRWEETQDIDSRSFSTLTRTGKVMIRSDNIEGLTPDQMRSAMIPTQPSKGFLRKSSRYVQDANGLGIAYTVVDVEQFKMPPQPAFEAIGVYQESVPIAGAKRYGMAKVRLKGSKDTKQHELAEAALQMVSAKLSTRGAQLGKGGFNILQYAHMTINMFDNEVEFTATAMMGASPKTVGPNAIAAFIPDKNKPALTYTPFSSDEPGYIPPFYKTHGTASIFLQAAAYYDPNLSGVRINDDTRQLDTGKQPGQI